MPGHQPAAAGYTACLSRFINGTDDFPVILQIHFVQAGHHLTSNGCASSIDGEFCPINKARAI
jgi:hypothetical protein